MRKLCRENISDNENNIVAGLRSTVRDMTRFAVPYNIITTGNLPENIKSFWIRDKMKTDLIKIKEDF